MENEWHTERNGWSFWLRLSCRHILLHLYRCTVHLDINVYVHQLMHLFISPREH
jgi:hypothetical protein